MQNFFVNPENPTQILGIIDWQSVSASPLFMQVTRSAFLDFDGPIPKELGKVSPPPELRNIVSRRPTRGEGLTTIPDTP
jgi:hypothetical protein